MLAFEAHNIPFNFWFLSAAVMAGGFLLILWATWLHKRKKRAEKQGRTVRLGWFVFADVLRDVGIACLVAIIVTGIYELYTREIFEGMKMQQMLKTVMTYDVPNSVWTELHDNILYRPVIRRKANVVFKVEKDPSFFGNMARLRMDYSYSLYGLGASSMISIRHDVVNHMTFRDYPRFESVSVTEPGKAPITYDRQQLAKDGMLKSFRTQLYLEPSYNFEDNTYDDSRAARIHSVRDEVINLPGSYPLGIPEVIEGPINVTVLAPDGIEPEVDAQWGQHFFGLKSRQRMPDEYTEYKYTFEGTLLPGQTLLLVFKVQHSPTPPTIRDAAGSRQ